MKREWLIELRKSKGLTQQKVADQSFIDRSYYSQLENGLRDPSPSVAENIAQVLDFNFMRFFTDYIYFGDFNSPLKKAVNVNQDGFSYLKDKKTGHVMYHYSSIEVFYSNTIKFILSKVEQNIHCIIIDQYLNYSRVISELKNLLPKNKIDKYVHFFHHNISTDQLPQHFFAFIHEKINPDTYFSIWISDTSSDRKDSFHYIKTFIETCEKELNDHEWLLVCSFDAHKVTANEYIRIMKLFEYIMTDQEMVMSPFYSEHAKMLSFFNRLEDKEH
ncbi:helix-turn-helix domain-containing protein [Jeotgalibacillus haloalkalitolerans]|uniref:Helix-turn-helix transcriptional regulator n=1 Tax=Jeotgalibacillus haloalkalitolerans TaxID=3104292 RepID=A0ABU5KNI9_9BACL|nr:helix-turn-helix transcriptional regulator [Jeotgalibacillus sp. HH7-29]MDZ5712648.1 helix-turn-helix transcriptional regulator [Jeotgalibacillus sp. HH7-29]